MGCQDFQEDMIDVLYGDADARAQHRLQQHERECAQCEEEHAALRRLRPRLDGWKLPSSLLRVDRIPVWRRAWFWPSLAAAAILAASVSLMGLNGAELRYEEGRLSLRMGHSDLALRREVAEHEAQHRREIEQIRAALGPSINEQAVLRQTSQMIRESEAQHRLEVQTSLAEMSARAEAQRRYDMARMRAGLSYLDGKSGQDVARTTELMGYMLQAAEKR